MSGGSNFLYCEKKYGCWHCFNFVNEVKRPVHKFPRKTFCYEIALWAIENGYDIVSWAE